MKKVLWGCARDANKNNCRKAFVCLCPDGLETIWNIVDGDHVAAAALALANSRLFKWYRSATRNPGRDSSTSVFLPGRVSIHPLTQTFLFKGYVHAKN